MKDTSRSSPVSLPKWLPLALIGLGAVFGAVFFGEYLSFEALRDNRAALIAFRDSHFWVTLAGFVGLYILIVTLSLPGATIATLAGGFLFGLATGSAATVVAATIGATLIFLAARHGFGKYLSARMDASEGRIKRIKDGLRQNEWSVLFLMRLVPALPFFVANLLPAFVGVRINRYVISTFFGIMPGTVVYTWVGVGLGEVFARDASPNLGLLFEPRILAPILALAALAALPLILKLVRPAIGEVE